MKAEDRAKIIEKIKEDLNTRIIKMQELLKTEIEKQVEKHEVLKDI